MKLIIGNKYNWKCSPEKLVYLGQAGAWHQFALIEKPDDVWCEVLESELQMMEETQASRTPSFLDEPIFPIRAISEWATRDTPRMRKIALRQRNDPPEVQAMRQSAAEAKRQRRAERNKHIATQERQP